AMAVPSAAQQRSIAEADKALLAKIHEWTTAAMTHRQGQPDLPAATVAGWTQTDIERVFAKVTCLREELVRLEKSFVGNTSGGFRQQLPCGRAYSTDELRDVLSLGDRGSEALPELFARAALLHTDIALLQPAPRAA